MVEIILNNLLHNEQYFMQVWHHLKPEYFDNGAEHVYHLIHDHFETYKSIPSTTALGIALDKKTIGQIESETVRKFLDESKSTPEDIAWLVKETETYCKDKAIYNALSRSIEIQENASRHENERDKRIPDLGAIEGLMRDAISVSFDNSIGHDWEEDYKQRFMMYQTKAKKIPFLLPILNKITKGGVERGTLNCILMPVNAGKSLGMCSLAAEYMQQGYDVLYITMEMGEDVVAKRIDANLLDVSLGDLDDNKLTFAEYKARIERITKGKKLGRMKIKQYPTGGASVVHFNSLMNDLMLKQNFKPDIVFVDYLGICASSRLRVYSENSYTLVKAIAEEIRGFAVLHNIAVWTGAQTTRNAWDSSDINMSDTAESAGLPATVDLLLGGIETEELAELGVQMFKQLKSRYGDKNYINKFQLGVKKGNQRWFMVDQPFLAGNDTKVDVNKAVQQPDMPFSSKKEKLDALAAGIKF